MTTIDDAPALFDVPAPVAPPSCPRGKNPPPPEPGEGARDAIEQPPPDPSRWAMTGWRDAQGVSLTREQILAVFNASEGPCAGCGATHHRYGESGNPLCPACRPEPRVMPDTAA